MIGTAALVGRRLSSFLVLLLGFLATVVAAESPQAEESWKNTSRQWTETVASGKRVQVVNPYGDIYFRFGGYENQVEVVATVQRLETHLPELKVAFRHGDEGLDVTVAPEAPAGPVGAPSAPGPEATRDRVDLAVFVPRGVALHARTGADRIEIKGLESDVTAESVKGEIRIVKVKGRVHARTERGQIFATLETGVSAEPQELSTHTGDITVHLWEDANTTVKIATSGEISTDYSLQVERRRFEEPGKHAVAVVGRGGPELTLSSKRGNIRLLWLPRHFKRENGEKSGEGAPPG